MDGYIVVIGQHVPVLMMLMNLVDVWWVFNMVTADREGEGKFFMNECTWILALHLVMCLRVHLILVTCFENFLFW